MRSRVFTVLLFATLLSACSRNSLFCGYNPTGCSNGNAVEITEPKWDAVVTSPFTVKFRSIGNLEVGPVGVTKPSNFGATAGYYVLTIDDGCLEGMQVPRDEHHLHYDKGQTEATVALPSGEHSLRLQFVDDTGRAVGGSGMCDVTYLTVK